MSAPTIVLIVLVVWLVMGGGMMRRARPKTIFALKRQA
jgi:hypothetical protein